MALIGEWRFLLGDGSQWSGPSADAAARLSLSGLDDLAELAQVGGWALVVRSAHGADRQALIALIVAPAIRTADSTRTLLAAGTVLLRAELPEARWAWTSVVAEWASEAGAELPPDRLGVDEAARTLVRSAAAQGWMGGAFSRLFEAAARDADQPGRAALLREVGARWDALLTWHRSIGHQRVQARLAEPASQQRLDAYVGLAQRGGEIPPVQVVAALGPFPGEPMDARRFLEDLLDQAGGRIGSRWPWRWRDGLGLIVACEAEMRDCGPQLAPGRMVELRAEVGRLQAGLARNVLTVARDVRAGGAGWRRPLSGWSDVAVGAVITGGGRLRKPIGGALLALVIALLLWMMLQVGVRSVGEPPPPDVTRVAETQQRLVRFALDLPTGTAAAISGDSRGRVTAAAASKTWSGGTQGRAVSEAGASGEARARGDRAAGEAASADGRLDQERATPNRAVTDAVPDVPMADLREGDPAEADLPEADHAAKTPGPPAAESVAVATADARPSREAARLGKRPAPATVSMRSPANGQESADAARADDPADRSSLDAQGRLSAQAGGERGAGIEGSRQGSRTGETDADGAARGLESGTESDDAVADLSQFDVERAQRSAGEAELQAYVQAASAPEGDVEEGLPSDVALKDLAPMSFVRLPGGSFQMGSRASEAGRFPNEGPRHKVAVSSIWMSTHEVTQKQWAIVMKRDPPGLFRGPNLPVESVSWCDAARFANVLSRIEERDPAYLVPRDCERGGVVRWDRGANGYRLPTEAEWEYAARAGAQTPFTNGSLDQHLSRVGWHAGNSGSRTHEVGMLRPNRWGIYDMHGNVYEWAWGTPRRYPSSFEMNPGESSLPGDAKHVFRGGSWYTPPRGCRSACRTGWHPGQQDPDIGFRLVRPVH